MIVSERTKEIDKVRQEILSSLPKSFSELVRMSTKPKATKIVLWLMVVDKVVVIDDRDIVRVAA